MPRQDYPDNGITGLLCSFPHGKGRIETMTVRRNHGIAKGMHCTEIPFSSFNKALHFFLFFKFEMFRAVAYFRAWLIPTADI